MTEFALASTKISKHFNRIMTKTFMNFMEIKNLQKQINILQNIDEAIIRDNNALENRSTNYTDQLNNNTQRELENLYRHIDSRVDKLEEKIKKEFQALNHTKSN